DDEQEIPVDQLSEIDSSIIELLVKSGFETLAELSVTKTQELAEIEGIDEETAVAVIEAAKKQMENMDSV
ncbi:MAG TPA: transcription termination/antitermination protein NusA, partial [Nitrospina sp.]|nr:transcription termination/antitermination protein NusA [Nitrospina sp.]